MSAIATRQPSRASRSAVAAPIPEPPPATIATFPSNPRMESSYSPKISSNACFESQYSWKRRIFPFSSFTRKR